MKLFNKNLILLVVLFAALAALTTLLPARVATGRPMEAEPLSPDRLKNHPLPLLEGTPNDGHPGKTPGLEWDEALEEPDFETDEDRDRRFVNLRRTAHDREYSAFVQKSMCIKQYLTSPMRDDPLYDEVMLELLRNGLGIEHWRRVCGMILAWQMPFLLQEEEMREAGYSGAEIQELIQERLPSHWERREDSIERLGRLLEVRDTAFLESLMDLPLYVPPGIRFFGDARSLPTDGERTYTDADWMQPHHKALSTQNTNK